MRYFIGQVPIYFKYALAYFVSAGLFILINALFGAVYLAMAFVVLLPILIVYTLLSFLGWYISIPLTLLFSLLLGKMMKDAAS